MRIVKFRLQRILFAEASAMIEIALENVTGFDINQIKRYLFRLLYLFGKELTFRPTQHGGCKKSAREGRKRTRKIFHARKRVTYSLHVDKVDLSICSRKRVLQLPTFRS